MGAEPRDVLNYNRESSNFLEETVADQWFSEAQFESYCMLGSHMIDKICGDSGSITLAGFAELVRERLASPAAVAQTIADQAATIRDPHQR